jgi:hypothetical protein
MNTLKRWFMNNVRDVKGQFTLLPEINNKISYYERVLNKNNLRTDLYELNKYKMITHFVRKINN